MVDTNKEWVNEPVGLGILPETRTPDVGGIAYWQNTYELRKTRSLFAERVLAFCGNPRGDG